MKYFVFLSLLLFSCSTPKIEKESATVDITSSGNDQELEIKEAGSIDYGPVPEVDLTKEKIDQQKKTVVAIDLLPTLYHSVGYISVLSELEKKNIEVSIISASGFSTIVGALYAKYGNTNRVEWKTFELFESLKDTEPHTSDWYEKIENFLDREFQKKKCNQLSKVFVIPFVNKKNLTVFVHDEKVVTAIMQNLYTKGAKKKSMLLYPNFDYKNSLKQFGADLSVHISFLMGNIKVFYPDGYLYGIYSRLSGEISQLKPRPYYYVKDDVYEGEIDKYENLSDLLYQASPAAKEIAEDLNAKIESINL